MGVGDAYFIISIKTFFIKFTSFNIYILLYILKINSFLNFDGLMCSLGNFPRAEI